MHAGARIGLRNKTSTSSDNSFTLSDAEDVKDSKPKTLQPGNDPLVESEEVYQLSACSFNKFLEKRDAVLVLFYNGDMKDKGNEKNQVARKNFIDAAEKTMRTRTAFATIDCVKSPKVCEGEKVTQFPLFKLYTRGILIGTVQDPYTFTSKAMKDFVSKVPVPK